LTVLFTSKINLIVICAVTVATVAKITASV
jgi:hypothetical protein